MLQIKSFLHGSFTTPVQVLFQKQPDSLKQKKCFSTTFFCMFKVAFNANRSNSFWKLHVTAVILLSETKFQEQFVKLCVHEDKCYNGIFKCISVTKGFFNKTEQVDLLRYWMFSIDFLNLGNLVHCFVFYVLEIS